MAMDRRDLLRGGAALVASALARSQETGHAPSLPDTRVNPERLRRRLEELSVFGRPAGGTFADGVSRMGYTDADVAGRKWAVEQMRAAGLRVRIDPAGNIIVHRMGGGEQTGIMVHEAGAKTILFGSHIDSVPNGGNFDGDVGSMAAIEGAHTLPDHGVETRHPLEVVIWAYEEGGLDRSRP